MAENLTRDIWDKIPIISGLLAALPPIEQIHQPRDFERRS
jgi:hypothetical protein